MLAQNAVYLPALGGANKSNRLLVEELAARGHACRAIAPAHNESIGVSCGEFLNDLANREIYPHSSDSQVACFVCNGVMVHAVFMRSRLRSYLVDQIREFEPDWILVSSEDLGQLLLEAAVEAAPSRVIYLAHTTLALPFGPSCFVENRTKTKLLQRTAGIITVSNYLRNYIREWAGLESIVLPILHYGPGPFPDHGRFDNRFVTMINPCAVKGISIFVSLAARFPEVEFATVPTWGTTDADRRMLESLGNVRILNPVEEIDEIYSQTRILLVPSLWAEAYGRVVIEAMLRGIPVLASNVGGLPEANLGVGGVLPIRPIERYESRLDSQMLPVPLVPEQDVEPWVAALRELLSDRARYERLSRESRQAALTFVSGQNMAVIESFLQGIGLNGPLGSHDQSVETDPDDKPLDHVSDFADRLNRLSPERRALLALRLGKKIDK
jgi:glycosyltransferase involved in cell wall biosynthesis